MTNAISSEVTVSSPSYGTKITSISNLPPEIQELGTSNLRSSSVHRKNSLAVVKEPQCFRERNTGHWSKVHTSGSSDVPGLTSRLNEFTMSSTMLHETICTAQPQHLFSCGVSVVSARSPNTVCKQQSHVLLCLRHCSCLLQNALHSICQHCAPR